MTDDVNIDFDRLRRKGIPEVIYGAGKTACQIIEAVRQLNGAGQNAFVTRISGENAAAVQTAVPQAIYLPEANILASDVAPLPTGLGRVAVIAAGTSDKSVAEEAAITVERIGGTVQRFYDVGVAGIHRLFNRLDEMRAADVLIVVAGMEGALPSVVGGLTDRPLIAVPTSIGYGANFGGIAALLSMMNACAAGITVVNIDNGFGAGVAAGLILRRMQA